MGVSLNKPLLHSKNGKSEHNEHEPMNFIQYEWFSNTANLTQIL